MANELWTEYPSAEGVKPQISDELAAELDEHVRSTFHIREVRADLSPDRRAAITERVGSVAGVITSMKPARFGVIRRKNVKKG